jgi:signal transduction histidine kinase
MLRTGSLRTVAQGGLLAAGFVIVLAMSVASLWLVRETDYAVEDAGQVSILLSRLADLRTDLLRAQGSQRGYLLTSDAAYREGFTTVRARIVGTLDELTTLSADEPELRASVQSLAALVTATVAELTETLELSDSGRRDEAMQIVTSDRGLALMNEFIGEATELNQSKSNEMAALLERAGRLRGAVLGINIAGAIIVAILATISVLLIRRKARELLSAHTALASVNQELERRVAERTADLREANEEIQRFAYIVSHDLRSPLVNVMGFTSELQALRKDLFPELETEAGATPRQPAAPGSGQVEARATLLRDFDEALHFITASIAKMDRLIQAVLQLSRAGRREFRSQPVDLGELVSGIAAEVQHRVQENDVELTIGRLPRVISDRLALEQIFSNLIDNALKYLRDGVPGRVEVSGRDGPTYVSVSVSDNGRGIEPKDRERIFDLFRRAGTQDRPGEGIGLAHARALVRRLGGGITVEGDANVGSTFTITLPKKWSE